MSQGCMALPTGSPAPMRKTPIVRVRNCCRSFWRGWRQGRRAVRSIRSEIVAGEAAAMQRLAARADPARWAGLRAEIERNFVAADELNLDRKQTMLGAFFAIAEMSR